MFCFALFGSLDKFTEDPRLSNIDILSFKHLEVSVLSTWRSTVQALIIVPTRELGMQVFICFFFLNINVNEYNYCLDRNSYLLMNYPVK